MLNNLLETGWCEHADVFKALVAWLRSIQEVLDKQLQADTINHAEGIRTGWAS